MLAAWVMRSTDRRLRWWLGLAAITYAPVSMLLPINRFTCDSYLYVPLAGLGLSAGAGLEALVPGRLANGSVRHGSGPGRAAAAGRRTLATAAIAGVVLAAHAAGLTEVILPERNRGDLDEVPEEVREQMAFHPVMTVQEVLDRALEPARGRRLGPVIEAMRAYAGVD